VLSHPDPLARKEGLQTQAATMSISRLRWFAAGTFVVLAARAIDSTEPSYQRCASAVETDENVTLAGSTLLASTCQGCSENPANEGANNGNTSVEEGRLHVMIQLTNPNPPSELLSIASGLLAGDMNVTVFYMNYPNLIPENYGNLLRRKVLAGIPCGKQKEAQAYLAINSIDLKPPILEACSDLIDKSSSFVNPLHECFVQMADAQYRLVLLKLYRTDFKYLPKVLLTELQGLGSLFFAEQLGIPSFIVNDASDIKQVAGPQPHGTWLSLCRKILSIPLDYMGARKSFVTLNRIRAGLELKPKRTISGFWEGATAFLALAQHPSSSPPLLRSNLPPLMHLKAPLFPPCVTCSQETNSTARFEYNSAVIIVLPPFDLRASQGREVIRGLSMARNSLHDYGDPQWNGPTDFSVKWMVSSDASNSEFLLQDPVPSFITRVNASLFIDNLLLSTESNSTPIVIGRCDGDVKAAILMRVPTLCLPGFSSGHYLRDAKGQDNNEAWEALQSIESKEVALNVLRMLSQLQESPPRRAASYFESDSGDSLQRVLDAVQAASHLVSQYRFLMGLKSGKPVNRRDLQRRFVMELKGDRLYVPSPSDHRPFYVTILESFAWLIFLLSLFYLFLKHVDPNAYRRLRIPRSLRNYFNHSRIWESMMARLPEVDRACEALIQLWKDNHEEGVSTTAGGQIDQQNKDKTSGRTGSNPQRKRTARNR
jgi:hypothetical protein